jgi:hypothetical protein
VISEKKRIFTQNRYAMQNALEYLASLPLNSQILMGACLLFILVVGAEVLLLARKTKSFRLAADGMIHPQVQKKARRAIDLSGLKRFFELPVRSIFGKAEYSWGEMGLLYLFLAAAVLTLVWLIGLVV